MYRRSTVDTSGDGGGAVFIRGGELVMDNSRVVASTLGAEDGAGIDVKINSLSLTNGAQIDTSTGNSSAGHGGSLTVEAGQVSLAGSYTNSDGTFFASGLFSGANGSGNAGFLKITANSLSLKNRAQIDASTFGTGRGGSLTVTSRGDINILGPMGEENKQTGLFSVTNDTGPGGSVFVTADGALTMDGSARILTRTLGTADAGSLTVKAGDLTLTNGAQIFAGIGNAVKNNMIQGDNNGTGKGGDISVDAGNTLSITGHDALIPNFRSGIFSAGQIGRGDAGNISVSAKRIELGNRGTISAFSGSSSLGNAGNIVIREVDSLRLEEKVRSKAKPFKLMAATSMCAPATLCSCATVPSPVR